MIVPLTPIQRLENLEARVHELITALDEIQNIQKEILENDQELFAIHKHNDKYLKEVCATQDKNEKLARKVIEDMKTPHGDSNWGRHPICFIVMDRSKLAMNL